MTCSSMPKCLDHYLLILVNWDKTADNRKEFTYLAVSLVLAHGIIWLGFALRDYPDGLGLGLELRLGSHEGCSPRLLTHLEAEEIGLGWA